MSFIFEVKLEEFVIKKSWNTNWLSDFWSQKIPPLKEFHNQTDGSVPASFCASILWCLCLWNEWRKKCAQFSCNTQRIHDPPKGVRNWKVVRYTCICKVYILLVTITVDLFQIEKGHSSINFNLRLIFRGTAFFPAILQLFHIKWQ